MSALIPFRINQSRKKGELEGKKREKNEQHKLKDTKIE